jgi:hypothetical protein
MTEILSTMMDALRCARSSHAMSLATVLVGFCLVSVENVHLFVVIQLLSAVKSAMMATPSMEMDARLFVS